MVGVGLDEPFVGLGASRRAQAFVDWVARGSDNRWSLVRPPRGTRMDSHVKSANLRRPQ
jgi:hypothetical protein